jgi:hypothetical protein
MPGAVEEAESFLADDYASKQRLQQVADLIEGFETPYGMELLATVHWVAHQPSPGSPERATGVDEAISHVHAWNPRKRSVFQPEHIRLAWSRLAEAGWMH